MYSLPALAARSLVLPVANVFATSVKDAGERGVFLATSSRYPPANPSKDFVGVPLPKGHEVATSSVVVDGKGNGVYRLGANDESAPAGDVLPGYRRDGAEQKVWKSTLEVWERALQRSASK